MLIHMVEVGVLLKEPEDNYEVEINNKRRYLYDENICAFLDKNKALDFIKDYVEKGVKNTYGVMWEVNRKLEEYELKEVEEYGYLEDEFLPRKNYGVYFKIKQGENDFE